MDDLLDFKIPEFTRLGWTSENAAKVWSERLNLVRAAWQDIEVSSVVMGVRDACFVRLDREEVSVRLAEWRRQGLETVDIDRQTRDCAVRQRYTRSARFVVCKASVGAKILQNWSARDHTGLLGYPKCCSEAYHVRMSNLGIEDA